MSKRDDLEVMVEIAERAESINISYGERITFMMDLMNAHETFNLRLEELLKADNLDFVHDVVGIQKNINRSTCEFMNCFMPRYSS